MSSINPQITVGWSLGNISVLFDVYQVSKDKFVNLLIEECGVEPQDRELLEFKARKWCKQDWKETLEDFNCKEHLPDLVGLSVIPVRRFTDDLYSDRKPEHLVLGIEFPQTTTTIKIQDVQECLDKMKTTSKYSFIITKLGNPQLFISTKRHS